MDPLSARHGAGVVHSIVVCSTHLSTSIVGFPYARPAPCRRKYTEHLGVPLYQHVPSRFTLHSERDLPLLKAFEAKDSGIVVDVTLTNSVAITVQPLVSH